MRATYACRLVGVLYLGHRDPPVLSYGAPILPPAQAHECAARRLPSQAESGRPCLEQGEDHKGGIGGGRIGVGGVIEREGGGSQAQPGLEENNKAGCFHARRTVGIRTTLLVTERLFWHCGAHTAKPESALHGRFLITKICCFLWHVVQTHAKSYSFAFLCGVSFKRQCLAPGRQGVE